MHNYCCEEMKKNIKNGAYSFDIVPRFFWGKSIYKCMFCLQKLSEDETIYIRKIATKISQIMLERINRIDIIPISSPNFYEWPSLNSVIKLSQTIAMHNSPELFNGLKKSILKICCSYVKLIAGEKIDVDRDLVIKTLLMEDENL